MEVAYLLHAQSDDNRKASRNMQRLEFCLIELAEEVCTDYDINTSDFTDSGVDVVGPIFYLLKLLVRQYGFPCMKKISKEHLWIIPAGLQTANQVNCYKVFIYENNTLLNRHNIVL